jgi:hypothetical protein
MGNDWMREIGFFQSLGLVSREMDKERGKGISTVKANEVKPRVVWLSVKVAVMTLS